jgi:hypothetical protein
MAEAPTIDYAATAFVLLCASLVLFMTVPGLALFYGGMSRAKSVLNMMMMSFGAAGVVGIIYVLYGYSMSFGSENLGGIIANPVEKLGLAGTDGLVNPFGYEGNGNIPELMFVGFQLTFAIITVALISGAIADRVKFSTWMVFAGIWRTSRSPTWCGAVACSRAAAPASPPSSSAAPTVRRMSSRSTSPGAPSSTSTRAWPAWSWPSSSASASASARSRCDRTTSR